MQQPHAAGANCAENCLPAFLDSLQRRMDTPLLQEAFASLRDHIGEDMSVGEWAQRLEVSREHLSRQMSSRVQPHALLKGIRVAIAISRLAARRDEPANAAMDLMGYNSRAHAFRVFRELTGLSPTEFRERLWGDDRESDPGLCVVDRCPLVTAILHGHDGEAPGGPEVAH